LEKIKLIWDFRGPVAKETAQHHLKHLQEFFKIEKKILINSGTKSLSDLHTITYVIVNKAELDFYKSLLRPHRGQLSE
tara:strand:+ start:876 stop:1109 length:234 start_codon:yes stop_codon:yes gene_type:complete